MRFILSACLFLVLTASLHAQSDITVGTQVELTLTDGAKITGEVLEINNEFIRINNASLGELKILQSKVQNIENIKEYLPTEIGRKGFPLDYHGSTHYLGTNSAFSLRKGEAYYENIWIFWNSATFGVTDHFSISLGGEIASLLFAGRVPILFVSPKLSTASGNGYEFAVSGTFFTSPEDDFSGFGVAQALVTLGDRNNNITFGAGIGFSTEGFGEDVTPLTLAFMIRLSKKASLVSDNFYIAYDNFSDGVGNLSLALRLHFMKNPGSSLTLGLFRPTEDTDELIAFPFVSATIPF